MVVIVVVVVRVDVVDVADTVVVEVVDVVIDVVVVVVVVVRVAVVVVVVVISARHTVCSMSMPSWVPSAPPSADASPGAAPFWPMSPYEQRKQKVGESAPRVLKAEMALRSPSTRPEFAGYLCPAVVAVSDTTTATGIPTGMSLMSSMSSITLCGILGLLAHVLYVPISRSSHTHDKG